MSILISIRSVSCLVHSNGTSELPPGCILMEHTKTSGTPDVVSGSSMTVDPLDLIIFLVPSWVQMTERSHNLDHSFHIFIIIPSFPTWKQHAHSVQNVRSRFNKLNQSYSC